MPIWGGDDDETGRQHDSELQRARRVGGAVLYGAGGGTRAESVEAVRGSASYDVGVEHKSGILRVQVKSTLYCRRNGEYSLNVMGPGRGRYKEGTVDFFAVYLIPIDAWYIVPYAVVGRKNLSLHFTPESRRHKYARYREAWELLRGEGIA